MALYHRDLGIPESVHVPTGRVYLDPSAHARREAQSDRYLTKGEAALSIPDSVTLTEDNVFEVETDGSRVVKVCCRVNYDATRDLILVILADGAVCDPLSPWTVKTVWVNVVDDTHNTLDASAYDIPDQTAPGT